MVHGAILDTKKGVFTDMPKVIEVLNSRVEDYNWLITDHEYYGDFSIENEYGFFTGEELKKFAEPNSLWVWAVVSGFSKEIPLSEILKYPLPYANGYTGFWHNPLSIQHPLAEVEIVAWDGVLTLFISKHKDLVDKYRRAFSLSRDLEEYNREF